MPPPQFFPVLDFETSFSTLDAINYTQEHSEIPVFAVAIYLIVSAERHVESAGGGGAVLGV